MAVFFFKELTLHHNSCAHINKKSKLFSFLVSISNKNKTTHVVNCKSMKTLLSTNYDVPKKNIKTISNISILSKKIQNKIMIEDKKINQKNSNFCIGFMGYLNSEKGIDDFAKVLTKLQEPTNKNLPKFIGKAVGPIHDHKLVKNIKEKTSSYIAFQDPLFGDERDFFFDNLDILLFPSKYHLEAEPLTIYHALERGVPVIATDIGCIDEMISGFENSFTFNQNTFIDNAVISILNIANKDSKELSIAKRKIINQYQNKKIKNNEEFSLFLKNLITNSY